MSEMFAYERAAYSDLYAHPNMSISLSSDAIPLNPLTPQATDVSWRDYPASIGGHNAITTAGRTLSDRLSGLSDVLFSDEIDLRIIDIWSDNGKYLS